MSNQHLKMQEDLYSEIEYHLARLYDEEISTFIYNGERITKFNFEEFASDRLVVATLFNEIIDRVWHMYEVHLTSEEAEYFDKFASDYLSNLLDEDIQEHRASERP